MCMKSAIHKYCMKYIILNMVDVITVSTSTIYIVFFIWSAGHLYAFQPFIKDFLKIHPSIQTLPIQLICQSHHSITGLTKRDKRPFTLWFTPYLWTMGQKNYTQKSLSQLWSLNSEPLCAIFSIHQLFIKPAKEW